MNRTVESQFDSGFAVELERLVLADLTAFYDARRDLGGEVNRAAVPGVHQV
jgi:hypothetical protein